MVRRSDSALLRCETLEARDVPAVVIDGTFVSNTVPPVPNGGTVLIQEVSFARTATNIMNQAFSALEPAATRERLATANDAIVLSANGDTLTITASDGIYVRYTNASGATFFHNRGNVLSIQNVGGVNVDLQLGGNDTITDTTLFASTLNAGPGNDTINAEGGGTAFNLALIPFLQNPGALTAAQLPLFGTPGPAKTLLGGDGDDGLTATGAVTGFILDGGAGNDVINVPTSGSLNFIRGGAGDDSVTGPAVGFFNFLEGGAGSDRLTGGFGIDFLDGGTGIDVLTGSGGGDLYLALDVDPDLIISQQGDIVFSDAFDLRVMG